MASLLRTNAVASFVLCSSFTAALGACGGAVAATSPASDTDVVTPTTPPPAPDTDDDVLAVFVPGLRLFSHDGSLRRAVDVDPPLVHDKRRPQARSLGGYLVAQTFASPTSIDTEWFTSDGAPLGRATLDGPWTTGNLGANGSIAYRFGGETPAKMRVVGADGSALEFAGFQPNSGATTDSYVFVVRPPSGPGPLAPDAYGWWKVGSSSPKPLAFTPAGDPSVVGRTVVYRAASTDAAARPLLVLETPDDVRTLELPSAPNGLPSFLTNDDTSQWALLGDASSDTVFRLQLATARMERLELRAPDGFRPWRACDTVVDDLHVDGEGQLVRAFRTDDRVALFRSFDGRAWTQVGLAATGVGGFRASVARGTFVIEASRQGYCFVPTTWSSPSGAPLGESTQVARPNEHVLFTTTHDLGQASFSRTGRYAAFWTPSSAGIRTLKLMDVLTATERDLLVDATDLTSLPVWVTDL